MDRIKYDQLEIARILGEPRDPRRPYSDLINAICNVDSADPDEYVYYFDVLSETDTIYTTVASGITQSNVSPDTPTLLTYVDIASPEYYVKITDLANAKERVLARKTATINRALNAYENYKIITLVEAAVTAQGNVNDLRSGDTRFNYHYIIDMIDQIIDYSENYVLVAGTQIDKDIKLFDWTDNKYNSSLEAFKDLGITVVRVNQTVTIDGSSTSVLTSTLAYLIGTKTEEPTKPILFVRKRMDDISALGGVVSSTGEKPERLIFVSPNPIQVSTTRYLAVGITGYEQITAAVTNPYALSKFTRSV